MLYEIDHPPTAANAAILLHPRDNVAVARVSLAPGQQLEVANTTIFLRAPIPAGHKIALHRIAPGDPLFRYGSKIGFASQQIEPGDHVHVHNLRFDESQTDGQAASEASRYTPPLVHPASFLGYLRPDGRVGTRNYIAIVAASNCAAYTAELIAASFASESLPPNVDGVVAFPHGDGCAQAIGPDTDQLRRTLEGVLHHPNVSAAIILGLGCEVNQVEHYLGAHGDSSPVPAALHGLTLQESGGTGATVSAARHQVKNFLEIAAAAKRTEVPASKISLGLNCGGSDSFSGITANPALGFCCDLIAAHRGTFVLAETTEIFGAEHLLVRRARTPEIGRKLLRCVDNYKTYLRQFGGSFNDNPSPGNKEGGLTNIAEKSLGAIAKAGASPVEDVVDYAEPVRSPGFVFMNTPGYDPVSITGLAAGGVNLIAFTTGRGSAIGFPNIPVLKIASNSRTYRRMQANMDINAGTIADGEKSVEEVGREIFDTLLRVASGKKTCAEKLGHREFAPWRIGPVL